MTHGCPGVPFINTAKRAMSLMSIGISGLAFKSNFQVGDKLLMDEVIGKASLKNSVKEAVKNYYIELPLDISVLGNHLV